jgi:hypothetical protein
VCLSVAVKRPDRVLSRGREAGLEWLVTHNGMGHRCGYVRVPRGHPWHGKGVDDVDAEAHGGLTFAEPDVGCGGGPDDAWWLGFDAAHAFDAPDPALPVEHGWPDLYTDFAVPPAAPGFPMWAVRTQEYVESGCRSLCRQAARAGRASVPPSDNRAPPASTEVVPA